VTDLTPSYYLVQIAIRLVSKYGLTPASLVVSTLTLSLHLWRYPRITEFSF